MPQLRDDMTAHTRSLPAQDPSRPPRSPVTARLLERARREWARQEYEAAERSLTNALALAPDDPEATRMLGGVVLRRGKYVRAIECFRKVLPVWPDDDDLRIGLGIALYEQGEVPEAVMHLRRACDPAHRSVVLSLARAQANLGRIDAAVAGFREVLQRDPGNAEGWFGLSNLNTVRFDAADLASLQRALARQNLPDRDRELLGFTFAKALENQGDYAQAFEVFRAANASRRRRVKWDAAGHRERIVATRRAFAEGKPEPLDPGFGHEAILIISVPRSGSTLVEHILASHPQVEGANEIRDLMQVIDGESARRGIEFLSWVPSATAQDWQRLGREYLARTARWRERKPRFTDKNLVSWYLVGAALAMLPAARVIVVRRDPVETCLACFRQCFSERSGFSCDLDDMADYLIDFLDLTRFWLEKYPDRVFDMPYEALLAEPEAMIRRLLDFCDLPFDPACLEFHKTPRTVQSLPSAAQVRQPLRRDTARSAHYGDKLDHLRQRLRESGVLAG